MWWWPVASVFVISLAVAVFAYVPPAVGFVVVGAFALALAVLFVNYGRTRVSVIDGVLAVGRTSIEGHWIGGAVALSGQEAADALGRGANTRDFLQTRPYIKDLVRVEIADPADPHPHWIISSRRAAELAAAVNEIAEAQR